MNFTMFWVAVPARARRLMQGKRGGRSRSPITSFQNDLDGAVNGPIDNQANDLVEDPVAKPSKDSNRQPENNSNADQADRLPTAIETKGLTKRNSTRDTSQLEYLISQSTQGIHFLFERRDIAHAMLTAPIDESDFFTARNMERVQSLISRLLDKPTLSTKERFIRSLNEAERCLLIRAYFHLVENALHKESGRQH